MATLDKDMKRMQQEAVQRVQEMQAQAQQRLNATPAMPPDGAPSNTNSNISEKNTPDSKLEPPLPPQASTVQGLFDGLMEDRERTMILILILLLFTEQADTSAIFPLLYLIL